MSCQAILELKQKELSSSIDHVFICSFDIIYSFCGASPVAQLVKNPPAMQETPVRFLGQEDPLEKIGYPL